MKEKISTLISILFFAVLILFAFSCKKEPLNGPETPATKEVSFKLSQVSNEPGGLKSMDVSCSGLQASYIVYTINGTTGTIPVFYVGNDPTPYSSSIKLPEAVNYNIEELLVYNDNNTPANLLDDVLISAVPRLGSPFASFVKFPLPYTFEVLTDLKSELEIEAVCFTPSEYQNFGFIYYQMTEIAIRELWVFGDFCMKERVDYAGSMYQNQINFPGTGFLDAPAIAKVEVWTDGVKQGVYENTSQGGKIRVLYADKLNVPQSMELKLFIYVREGGIFAYKYFHSWYFQDVSNIPEGNDGVIDYVLGSCYDPSNPPDLILAPYMNLPLTATYTIGPVYNPGLLGAYVDAQITNVGIGCYDIHNGIYPSNCSDHNTVIYVGNSYDMNVYSSLYPAQLPLFARSDKWNKINWIYNHLDYFAGFTWKDLQNAIWSFETGWAPEWFAQQSVIVQSMHNQADQYGADFVPAPGGFAAVIFVPVGTPNNAPTPTVQTMFIQIDP